MAQILSEEAKEVVQVKRVIRTLEGIKCDACGRTVPAIRYREPKSKYFRVTTGHNDWGNDSFESIEHLDVCPECIPKFISDYLLDRDGYPSAYLDVETEYCFPQDVYSGE